MHFCSNSVDNILFKGKTEMWESQRYNMAGKFEFLNYYFPGEYVLYNSSVTPKNSKGQKLFLTASKFVNKIQN